MSRVSDGTVSSMAQAGWRPWRSDPPPALTWVRAKYDSSDKEKTVKTCRRGCCVYWLGESMMLPEWWRALTKSQQEDAQREADAMVACPDPFGDHIDIEPRPASAARVPEGVREAVERMDSFYDESRNGQFLADVIDWRVIRTYLAAHLGEGETK